MLEARTLALMDNDRSRGRKSQTRSPVKESRKAKRTGGSGKKKRVKTEPKAAPLDHDSDDANTAGPFTQGELDDMVSMAVRTSPWY